MVTKEAEFRFCQIRCHKFIELANFFNDSEYHDITEQRVLMFIIVYFDIYSVSAFLKKLNSLTEPEL